MSESGSRINNLSLLTCCVVTGRAVFGMEFFILSHSYTVLRAKVCIIKIMMQSTICIMCVWLMSLLLCSKSGCIDTLWCNLLYPPRIYCFHFCVSVCLWALSPIGLNWQNDVLFAKKCIRLVCEKLTLSSYVGNVVLLTFWWYNQVQDWSGGFREMYKKRNTYITQNAFTAARRAVMTSWQRPAKRSFIRHYCVANSFGGYMHSLSAF